MCESLLITTLRNFISQLHECVCACLCVCTHTCVFPFCLFLSSLSYAGLFSSMNFHFLSTLWLIGFRKATCASRCLWTCTLDVCGVFFFSSPASWLIVNSSSAFWHVQINNHSVKMNMATFVPVWCTENETAVLMNSSLEFNKRSKNVCFCVCICISIYL